MKESIRAVAVLAITMASASCSGDSRGPSRAPSEAAVDTLPRASAAPVQKIPCEDLEVTILRAAANRADLLNTFGRPDSVIARAEPNRHVRGATDSLFVVYYPGLRTEVRKPSGGTDLPVHVRVSDNRFLAYPQIGIGAAAREVTKWLGDPRAQDSSLLVYDCGVAVEQPVKFELANGMVTAVTIEYYVD